MITADPDQDCISYQTAEGRWRTISSDPADTEAAIRHIKNSGGVVAMVNSHWYIPTNKNL